MSDAQVMVAKTDNAKGIFNMLSAIHLKKDITAFCVMDRNGFRFTVEMHSALQAHVYLKADIFNDFRCQEKQQFGINLTLLLECLNIFGGSNNFVSLVIKYAGEGRPLLLEMSDAGVVSSSGLHTIDCGDPTDFMWGDSPLVNRAIMLCGPLRDMLGELDWWGSTLTLEMSKDSPNVRMTSKGDHGACCVEFPAHCEPFVKVECTSDTKEDYRFQLLQSMYKGVSLSEKACIRVNGNGMLSLQLMMRDGSNAEPTFVEFLVCADAPESMWDQV